MTFAHESPMHLESFVVRTMSMLFCFGLAAFVTGCGTTATITRKSGWPIEGEITTSNRRSVYIRTSGGAEVAVARNDIDDIDHPGNVAATIGGIVTAYGIFNIFAGARNCGSGGAASCAGIFLPAAAGVPMHITGLLTYVRSDKAASRGDKATARHLTVVPIASLDKTNPVFGASARVSF